VLIVDVGIVIIFIITKIWRGDPACLPTVLPTAIGGFFGTGTLGAHVKMQTSIISKAPRPLVFLDVSLSGNASSGFLLIYFSADASVVPLDSHAHLYRGQRGTGSDRAVQGHCAEDF